MHPLIHDALRAALDAAAPPIDPATSEAILAEAARRLAAVSVPCPCGGGRVTIYMEGGQVVDIATDGPHELTIIDWDEHPDWPEAIGPDGHPAPALQACIDAAWPDRRARRATTVKRRRQWGQSPDWPFCLRPQHCAEDRRDAIA